MNPAGNSDFSTTHWSLVLASGGESPYARMALETLCGRYWFPVYAFVRRQGHSINDAQDMTQAFFTRLLEKDDLRQVDPQRGRFRSFLLASVRHFLANARDFERAKKRGGDRVTLSLDLAGAEARYQADPPDPWTAERLFQRRWALELLTLVLARLEEEQQGEARAMQFALLKGFLDGSETRSYQEAATELGMTEGAVKTAVHRLRRRYRLVLREEIAQTLEDPNEIEEEIQQLFVDLGRSPK